MVVAAWAGKSVHQGMNSPFLEAMHGSEGNLRLIAALVISFAIALPLLALGRRLHRLSRRNYGLSYGCGCAQTL